MDQLAWRIEYRGHGPFSVAEDFYGIQTRILELGPEVDQFGTTFLNIYDQHSTRPSMTPEFEPFLDEIRFNRDLRFGFNTKNDLEEAFRLSDEAFALNPKYYSQFSRLLNQEADFLVKVYLIEPIAKTQTESLFSIQEAKLVWEANNIRDFTEL